MSVVLPAGATFGQIAASLLPALIELAPGEWDLHPSPQSGEGKSIAQILDGSGVAVLPDGELSRDLMDRVNAYVTSNVRDEVAEPLMEGTPEFQLRLIIRALFIRSILEEGSYVFSWYVKSDDSDGRSDPSVSVMCTMSDIVVLEGATLEVATYVLQIGVEFYAAALAGYDF